MPLPSLEPVVIVPGPDIAGLVDSSRAELEALEIRLEETLVGAVAAEERSARVTSADPLAGAAEIAAAILRDVRPSRRAAREAELAAARQAAVELVEAAQREADGLVAAARAHLGDGIVDHARHATHQRRAGGGSPGRSAPPGDGSGPASDLASPAGAVSGDAAPATLSSDPVPALVVPAGPGARVDAEAPAPMSSGAVVETSPSDARLAVADVEVAPAEQGGPVDRPAAPDGPVPPAPRSLPVPPAAVAVPVAFDPALAVPAALASEPSSPASSAEPPTPAAVAAPAVGPAPTDQAAAPPAGSGPADGSVPVENVTFGDFWDAPEAPPARRRRTPPPIEIVLPMVAILLVICAALSWMG